MDVRSIFFFLHMLIKIVIEISNGNVNILTTKKILSNLVIGQWSYFQIFGLEESCPYRWC